MINLLPPVLKPAIAEHFDLPLDRIFYSPDYGANLLHEPASNMGELHLPFSVFWLQSFLTNPARQQTPRSHRGWHDELAEPLKRYWRDIRLIARDFQYDIHLFTGDVAYMQCKLCDWAHWAESFGDPSPKTLDVTLSDGERSVTIPNHMTFGDPEQLMETDLRTKGAIFHWVFPLTVHSWCVDFGKTASILKIEVGWYDANAAPPLLLDTTVIPET